jgi:phage shock protein PspC (stress-responsive transcriptional regulator)
MPVRARQGRLLGGVCAGLAHDWHIDVAVLRLVFLLLALVWGLGVFLYFAAWLMMAREGAARPKGSRMTFADRLLDTRQDVAGVWQGLTREWRGWGRGLAQRRRWAVGLLAAGALVLVTSLGGLAWVTPVRALGLACLTAGAGLLLTMGK